MKYVQFVVLLFAVALASCTKTKQGSSNVINPPPGKYTAYVTYIPSDGAPAPPSHIKISYTDIQAAKRTFAIDSIAPFKYYPIDSVQTIDSVRLFNAQWGVCGNYEPTFFPMSWHQDAMDSLRSPTTSYFIEWRADTRVILLMDDDFGGSGSAMLRAKTQPAAK